MPGEEVSLHDLDSAIRARAARFLSDGEQVATWIVIVGTRSFNVESVHGTGGTTITLPHMGCMPPWEAKGLMDHAKELMGFTLDPEEEGEG